MNKSFLLLTTLFLSLAATAQEDLPSFTVGKIRYQIVDEAQHWAQVTSPASGHYQGITSSDMASTVTYNGVDYTVYGIGPGAFVDATVTGLLTLPDGLIYIDNGAFDGAGGDGSGIRIPNSMQFISDIAFVNNRFGIITCRDANPYFSRIDFTEQMGSTMFALANKEGNKLLAFPGQKMLSSVGDGTYVTRVTIPEQITEIGAYAFHGNSKLTNVTFHEGVVKIGDHAFANCKKLTSVQLPSGSVELAGYVWSGCDNVASVSLPQGIKLGNHDFYCCSIENLTVPEGVTVVPMMCFAGNELKSLSLPSTLECIDSCGFQNNPDLHSVDLKNVKRLEHFAFMGCTGLTSYTCNGQLEYLSTTVFCNTGLTDAMLPEGLKFMDGNVFFSTNSLQTITIPSTVETVAYNPITKCPNVKRVQVAEGNTHYAEIDSCLYEINASGAPVRLVSVPQGRINKVLTVPNGVTVVARQAARTVELTEIYLPASVQELEPSAFSTITATTRVTCMAVEPPALGEGGAFFSAEVFANATLYVPLASVEKYKAAAGWQEFQHIEGIDTGEEPGVPGDLNGDGNVDIEDVNLLINLILDKITPEQLQGDADLDGSGTADVADVNNLINLILNQ